MYSKISLCIVLSDPQILHFFISEEKKRFFNLIIIKRSLGTLHYYVNPSIERYALSPIIRLIYLMELRKF